MVWIRWAFIAANALYSLIAIYWSSRSPVLSTFGKIAGATPWFWQLLGVVLVILLHVSAWHLLWWFIAGYLLIMWGVRIMCNRGYETTC
jgi:hypothetical protein